MVPAAQGHGLRQRLALRLIGSAVAVVAVVAGLIAVPQSAWSNLAKHNIFALVGALNGTAGQMLQHTRALSSQVDSVQKQLSQLQQQDQIVQQQEKTGRAIEQQMTEQQQLTAQGVHLMSQILQRETTLAHSTSEAAAASSQLTTVVHQNAVVLGHLTSSMATTNQESQELNQQLGTLVADLQQSAQEFKFFGQVEQLLSKLLGGHLGSVGSSLGNTLGNALGSTLGNTLGNTLGALTSGPASNQSPGNPIQSVLNGLL